MLDGFDADCVSVLTRACITCPPGRALVVNDYSGIEARVNAWAAGDEPALRLFRKEGHPLGFECDGCHLCDPYLAIATKLWNRPLTKSNKLERGIGKRCELGCFAGDTLILTRRGAVAMLDVCKTDMLWDGVGWVSHAGVVSQGTRETVDLCGVQATPEHLVLCEAETWYPIEKLARDESTLCRALAIGSESLPSSDSCVDTQACPTGDPCKSCNLESSNSRPVYDIAHAGPRNRFTILTARGPLIVHNCGYGMGGKKFRDTVVKFGGKWEDIDIPGVPTTGDPAVDHLARSTACVDAWRSAHSPIVSLWRALEAAAKASVQDPGTDYAAGPVIWRTLPGHDVTVCILPSGRCNPYQRMRIEEYRRFDEETEIWQTRSGLRYDGKRNGVPGRIATYGGALDENVVQAISRDLLADAMIRIDRELDGAGDVVLHVHDEPVIECDEADAEDVGKFVRHVMRDVPAWAAGMPVDVEGFETVRYRK